MDALADLELRDRAAMLGDVLVLADLHVGRGAASTLELPVGEGEEMVERFGALCDRFEPAEVVVAGDLLPSFDTVPVLVEDTLAGLRAAAREVGARMVVTPGNHDTMLDVVWNGPTTPEYRVDDTVICHGHVEPEADADRYVIGHDHPAIEIEGARHPCFLWGEKTYRGGDVLVVPAFTELAAGSVVNGRHGRDMQSPLLSDLDAFRPVVRVENDGETLVFPPLESLRGFL